MEPYPHRYVVDASGGSTGTVLLSSSGLPTLQTAAPVQFGGPGDQWSPETLLVGAAADCFLLTFRAIAAASKFSWTALRCNAEGLLERVDGTARFTQLLLRARLTVPPGTDADKARRLLEKAEKGCLITNSLALRPVLTCEIESGPDEQLAGTFGALQS